MKSAWAAEAATVLPNTTATVTAPMRRAVDMCSASRSWFWRYRYRHGPASQSIDVNLFA
ncbi:hypothetical protein Misp04_45830 [Micromonospora sp. NBRC 101691]|nr:hypothetical protein Misp04_45830 [Micromonospora sp. NBRC 101691]